MRFGWGDEELLKCNLVRDEVEMPVPAPPPALQLHRPLPGQGERGGEGGDTPGKGGGARLQAALTSSMVNSKKEI